MAQTTLATPDHPLYRLDQLIEKRRNILRYARTFPQGAERNQHRQIAVSLRVLFRNKSWLATNTNQG
jgi:hypothetical protein